MVNIIVFSTIKQSSVLWGKKNPTFAKRNAYMQASLDSNFRIMTNIDKAKVLRIKLIQRKIPHFSKIVSVFFF